jgi:hypothetical protein
MDLISLAKAHVVSAPLLLIKLEHIRAEAKLAQEAVTELLEFAEHLVLFLLLLRCDASRKLGERALGEPELGRGFRENGNELSVVWKS